MQTDDESKLYLRESAPDAKHKEIILIEVMIANVKNLSGIEFTLKYDPKQLSVQDTNDKLVGTQIKPGSLFPDSLTNPVNTVNHDTGTINFAASLIGKDYTINENGSLAIIIFNIIGNGPYEIMFDRVNLSSPDGKPLHVKKDALTIEALPTTPPPTLTPTPEVIPTPSESSNTVTTELPTWAKWGLISSILVFFVILVIIPQVKKRMLPTPTPIQTITHRPDSIPFSQVQSPTTLIEQGYDAMEHGDIETAIEKFNEAIELDPASSEAWFGKGLASKQPKEKRLCFRRVLALDTDNNKAKIALEEL